MTMKVAGISKRFAVDTKAGVAVIATFALPAVLGISALALEYGTAVMTKSSNQRTSDLAAFAAAFEYNKRKKDESNDRVSAAEAAAKAVAVFNGVASDITVSFDDPSDATSVSVVISEDRPVFLSRLIRPDDHVTITTSSRISLGEAGSGFIPCIVALDDSASEGLRVNGNAGTYNMQGCGIGSNAEIVANGQTIDTSCAAPGFKSSWTCEEQTEQDGFTDPFAHLTNWPRDPNNHQEQQICDAIGTFPDGAGMSTKVSGEKKNDDVYMLTPGVLCVDGFSSKFDEVFSDPSGGGNTVIVKAGVNFSRGGNYSLSVTPPGTGSFQGVAIYAPESAFTLSGNPDFSVDGLGCSGLVVGSMRFNGNVTVNAQCGEDDVNYGAGSTGPAAQPRLIQ